MVSFGKGLFIGLLGLSAVSLSSRSSALVCLEDNTKRYSAGVALVAGASSVIPGPVAEAVRKGAVGGTAIGELVNYGWSWLWDPHRIVFPNDLSNVVFAISDAQVIALADSILAAFPHDNPYEVTFNDLVQLNDVTPGMGDAAAGVLVSGVKAFAYTIQGAAAYGNDGYFGSPDIIEAANLLNGAIDEYRSNMAAFAVFLEAYDDTPGFPRIQASDFLGFIADVQGNGESALPPGEVDAGNIIVSLANAHFEGSSLGSSLASFIAQGDLSNEASGFPADGYTVSSLITSGLPYYDIDCTVCLQIARPVPEPSTWLYLVMGFAVMGFSLRLANFNTNPRLPFVR